MKARLTDFDIKRPIDRPDKRPYTTDMKITKISASFSRKVQIRQFEPIEVFASAEAELDDEESNNVNLLEKCYSNLVKLAKTNVDNQLNEIVNAGKPKAIPQPPQVLQPMILNKGYTREPFSE